MSFKVLKSFLFTLAIVAGAFVLLLIAYFLGVSINLVFYSAIFVWLWVCVYEEM